MSIKFQAIGGYNEVGRNMSAIHMNDESILFDTGLHLPPILELGEQRKDVYNEKELRHIGALPDDNVLGDLKKKVKAICISHAHLDHVGAAPYIAEHYNADIFGSPYTCEFLRSILKDSKKTIKNQIRTVNLNSSATATRKSQEVEFVNITHSIPQASLIVLHTKKGAIVYANDFKFDNSPIIGKRPNYERFKQLNKEGVLALIVDSIYAGHEGKTPSEKIARGLLEDVLLTVDNERSGIVVTTFSSHIARLKSIVDCGKLLNRKILFVGRSLHRYVSVADKLGLAPFMHDINLVTYRNQLERKLKKANQDKKNWLIVCTGHQGEPGSILERMSKGIMPYKLSANDQVIFSSKIIPTPETIKNRQELEKRLRERKVRIFSNIHVSGHCEREDLRDLIGMLNPQQIIPAHAELEKRQALAELAKELGYEHKDVHLVKNGQTINLI